MKNLRQNTWMKLREKNVQVFLDLLDGWNGKLTWDLLIDAFERRAGLRFTRQALDRNGLIKNAFQTRKRQLRGQSVDSPTADSVELQVALDRCARLEAENARLVAQNDAFHEQFVRWLYNASRNNINFKILDAKMPDVDRRSTRPRE
jgi:hypothetical protein